MIASGGSTIQHVSIKIAYGIVTMLRSSLQGYTILDEKDDVPAKAMEMLNPVQLAPEFNQYHPADLIPTAGYFVLQPRILHGRVSRALSP